jgi:hypothetical protein
MCAAARSPKILASAVSNGVLGNPIDDVVVMDDFLFGEPTAAPEPSSVLSASCGAVILLRYTRRRNPRGLRVAERREIRD